MNTLSNKRFKLEIFRKISELKLNTDDSFELFENAALYSKNDVIRYLTAQILFENFPEKSKPSLKFMLLRDLNYSFRVLNYMPTRRHNINDILNSSVQNKQNREEMIEQIIDNEFLRFTLYYRDYLRLFEPCYNLNLRSFVLIFKHLNEISYFCRYITDPFKWIPIGRIVSVPMFVKIFQGEKNLAFSSLLTFMKDFLNLKEKDLEIASLKVRKSDEIPNFKLFSTKNKLLIYF